MRSSGVTGVVLMFESGGASGAWEDGQDGTWSAEALNNGVPYAEGSGGSPLNAMTALAQALAAEVRTLRGDAAAERVADLAEGVEPFAPRAELLPDDEAPEHVLAQRGAAKARLAAKRARASAGDDEGRYVND
jgi:hypothetical protein